MNFSGYPWIPFFKNSDIYITYVIVNSNIFMENFETSPSTAEEILEELILFHDPDKIKDTLELLVECYIASALIDNHRKSKKMDIYNHINKLKEFLCHAKVWQEKRFSGKVE
jgi:hypothetical protein